MINSLLNQTLGIWFTQAFQFIPCNDLIISTTGSQPFLEQDFDNYLRANGITPNPLHEDTEVLIIGHEDWDEDKINLLLDEREGRQLRVYSQEMYLAHWTTKQDPFENEDVLRAFAEGHEALKYLQTCWVDWTTTYVSLESRGGHLTLEGSPEKSVLKDLGYTVGKTKGLSAYERQEILLKVFNGDLPKILSRDYIKYCRIHFPYYLQRWGEPKSQERLIKMRDFITTNCKQQKRKGNLIAALDYQEDLDWLDMCLRTGRFKFNFYKAYIG